MKKACTAAGLGAILAFSSLAGATPWTETVGESGSAIHTFNNGQPSYTYTYNIANMDGNNAFMPGTDQISSGELVLHFKNGDVRDTAQIRLGDYTTTITNMEEVRIQLPTEVLNQLNSSGSLPMTINATEVNSFRLEHTVLNVSGVDNSPFTNGTGDIPPNGDVPSTGNGSSNGNGPAPVPEPSTFILLGACLAGVAFLRRKVTT